jgi:ferredoxin
MALKEISHHVTRPGRKNDDPEVTIPIAKDLVTVPGVPTREDDVNFFSREYPIDSQSVNDSASFAWLRPLRQNSSEDALRQAKYYEGVMAPFAEWINKCGDQDPTAEPSGEDVTELVRHKARELGCGEVGFTFVDTRYIFKSKMAEVRPELTNAVCLAVEQDYEMTQQTPGLSSEWTHDDVYERQGVIAKQLVEYINSLGYRAQVSGPTIAYGPAMPMFVAAGLGQVGANGIMMSPHFGPWSRLQIIFTDAVVTHDEPIDYGIHAFCQICQVCTNRCPGRALQREKVWYRGAHKNKVTFKRCAPMIARYSSCGVCQKVCPIGAYGMKAVMNHYVETGEVLGKGTDNLEGYDLPGMGYFGPGDLPRFDRETFAMPRGRSEDWMLIQFRDKLIELKDDPTVNKAELWKEFREKVEETINRDFVTEMAMDSGGELS